MTSSLVGSEMCIRDRDIPESTQTEEPQQSTQQATAHNGQQHNNTYQRSCLLYTSDAADDM
eukprot:4923770-Prorocentrum_lima.AAC.1